MNTGPAPALQPLGNLLNQRQKLALLFSLMACMFVSALDSSIVATATPRILADLGGFSRLSWVFTIYMLSSTTIVPIVGKLSDMFGRKLFIIGGIATFLVGSAACGAAPSMTTLILARGLQGFGGGTIFACVFATLGDLYPPAERAKYMGLFTGTFTLASLSGPTIGGLLTDNVGWRWCFYVNVPVGCLASLFIALNLPFRRRGGSIRSVDFLGSALLSGATISLLLALVWAQAEYGWSGPETLTLFFASATLVAAFILQERRHPEAIFPLHLFRNRTFVLCNLLVVLSGAGLFGAVQYLPTFVQTSLGASATTSGIITTPQSLGLLLTSIVGGQLLSRTGRWKRNVLIGGILILGATILLQTVDVGVVKWHISLFMVVYGLGSGLVMPTMSVIIQSAVSHDYLGVATAGRQFFMQIGQVLGTAVFGVILASTYASSFSSSLPADAKTELPPSVVQEFHDPTLALNQREFAQVKQEAASVSGGQALLGEAVVAQRESVAVAMRRLFFCSSLIAVAMLVVIVSMTEIPLRRSFAAEPGATADRPMLESEPFPAVTD